MKDILIFGGQSNMEGQTEKLLHDTPVPDAVEYRYLTDTYIPLQNPCGEDIRFDGTAGYPYGDDTPNWHADNALGSAVYGNTTLLPAFCEAYIAEAKKRECFAPVVAVHDCKGATDMTYWLTDGYRLLVDKAEKAIAGAGETRKRYFIWLQGESDAIVSRKCAEYKKMLSDFGHTLRERLALDGFGIIRVGRFTMDERDDEIIRAQDEICREDDFFVMLTDKAAEYCTVPMYKDMMNPYVGGHYSAAGLESLGNLAGTALAKRI